MDVHTWAPLFGCGDRKGVLLPIAVFKALQDKIERELEKLLANIAEGDHVAFDPADYVDNPIALARLKSHMRQSELAELLGRIACDFARGTSPSKCIYRQTFNARRTLDNSGLKIASSGTAGGIALLPRSKNAFIAAR